VSDGDMPQADRFQCAPVVVAADARRIALAWHDLAIALDAAEVAA
jgi:hypothetical protein